MEQNRGYIWGRMVLFVLCFIHFVLPFTPANQHPEQRIVVASIILGIVFCTFLVLSFKKPFQAFSMALALLISVYIISALTGASPVHEGFFVKILFAAGLTISAIQASTRRLRM